LSIQQTSAQLAALGQTLSTTTLGVDLLANSISKLEDLTNAGGFLKYQQTLLDLNRNLTVTRSELDLVAKSIDSLSKSTQYYSKSTLTEMVANFSKGTSALSAYRAEHEKLTAALTGTFKQGADRYAASLAELAKTMPDLTRKINSGAKDFSTFNEILRKGGVEALVAYKAAIGDLNSEVKKLDNASDTLSKFKKQSEDLKFSLGNAIGGNLEATSLLGGLGVAGGIANYVSGGTGKVGAFGSIASRVGPGVLAGVIGSKMREGAEANSLTDYAGRFATVGGYTLAGSAFGPIGTAGGALFGMGKTIWDTVKEEQAEKRKIRQNTNDEIQRIYQQGLENEFGSFAANTIRGSFTGEVNSTDYYANEAKAFSTEASGRGRLVNALRGKSSLTEQERDILNKAQMDQLKLYLASQESASYSTAGAQAQFGLTSSSVGFSLATNPGAVTRQQSVGLASSGQKLITALEAEFSIAQQDNSVQGQQNQARIIGQLMAAKKQQGGNATAYEQGQISSAGLNISQLGITQQTAQFGGASYSVLNQNSQAIAAEYDRVAEMSKLEAKKLQDLGLEVDARNKLKEAAEAELAADKARAESAQRTLQLQQFATSLRIEARGLTTKGTGLYSQSANIDDQIKQLIDEKYTAGTTSERRASIDKEISSLQQQQKFNSTQLMLGQTEQTGIELQGRFSAVGSLGAYEQSSILKNRIDYLQQELELQKQLDPLQRRKIAFEKERTETELKISQIQEKLQTTTFQQGINDINLQAAQITRNPFIASKFVKQGIELSKERLGGLNEQLAEAQKSGNQTAVQSLQTQIAQEQLKVLQSIDFQRRSFAEQFTATSFGMAQGSYLFSGQPSQYSVLGSGYYEGISANGPKDGTYQTQIAQMFGEGADERTPIEHLFNTIINGVNFKDGATFKINLEGWDGQSPLNAVKVPTP
jgi:hypothetical protein